eukprot:124335-Rhodomonas_salina.2
MLMQSCGDRLQAASWSARLGRPHSQAGQPTTPRCPSSLHADPSLLDTDPSLLHAASGYSTLTPRCRLQHQTTLPL